MKKKKYQKYMIILKRKINLKNKILFSLIVVVNQKVFEDERKKSKDINRLISIFSLNKSVKFILSVI